MEKIENMEKIGKNWTILDKNQNWTILKVWTKLDKLNKIENMEKLENSEKIGQIEQNWTTCTLYSNEPF